MELELDMADQVANLVHGWDSEILDAITGHLLPGEADLLARVFAALDGLEGGLRVMTSFMEKTLEDSSDELDWAADASVVVELGWLNDPEAWDRVAATGTDGSPVLPAAEVLRLAALDDDAASSR